MRRIVSLFACLVFVFVLSGCGRDKKQVTTADTTTAAGGTSITAVTTPPTTVGISATSIAVTTTTAPECPNTGSTGPQSTTAAQAAALLTKVAVTSAGCRDTVTFTYRKSGVAVPSCKVRYQPGPFTQDASGAPVKISGGAFLVVRCEPAYGYDFASGGGPTYTGPKRIVASGTRHVREVVQTGDFEGVMTWVIGVDVKRAYGLTAGSTPERLLSVTFS